jgi:hypothetical protein
MSHRLNLMEEVQAELPVEVRHNLKFKHSKACDVSGHPHQSQV